MRRLLALSMALAALAGCVAKEEGRACADDPDCPSGQKCGYDLRCSKAAAACPDAICHEDECPSGAQAQACLPRADHVCAVLDATVLCGGSATCHKFGGIARCIAAQITAPEPNAPVGASVPVTATLTFGAGGPTPPGTVELHANGSRAGALSQTALIGQVATYSGTYSPTTEDGDVALTVWVPSTPPVESPQLTVNVDTKAPVISAATATCPQSPCYRDDILTVTPTVSDPHLASVTVSLSLDGFVASAPTVSGSALLALKDWPLQGLADALKVRVVAADDRRNNASLDVAVTGGVTRVKPALESSTSRAVTSPAVDARGMAIFGVADITAQLRGFGPDGNPAWATTLEAAAGTGGPVTASPSIGAVNLFVGSDDGRIYRTTPAGTLPSTLAWYPAVTSLTPDTLLTPAIASSAGVDHAYSVGGAARLYQFCSDLNLATVPVPDAAATAAVVSGGDIVLATSTGSAVTLRRFTDIAGAPAQLDSVSLTDGGAPPVPCDKVTVPLAADGAGSVLAACDNGQIHRVAAGQSLADQLLYKLPSGVRATGSLIVARDGDILLPGSDGNVWKLTPEPGATPAWTAQVAQSAGEFPTGVVAVAPVAAVSGPDFMALTSQGRVVALSLKGGVKWSAVLPGSPGSLAFPVVAPVPTGGSPYALPTLMAGSSTGRVVRVVVDGALDTAAPWPKAHHDLRNTGNTDAPLP